MAKFEQGESGNPAGRPKGVQNQNTQKVRAIISEIVLNQFTLETIEKDLKNLKTKDRLFFLYRLLDFILPKIRATEMKVNYEDLSDEELNHVFEKIINQR